MQPPSAVRFCIAGLLLAVFLVYLPGAKAPFYLDDEHNIAGNPKTDLHHIFDIPSLISRQPQVDPSRLFSYWTFGINRLTTGLEKPGPPRMTNVGIHLFNTLLVYLLLSRILSIRNPLSEANPYLAVSAAGLWALHPLNSQSVLYIVQRMTLLSATFSLLSFFLYLDGRARTHGARWVRWIMILPALALGLLSKQSAALIPIGILLLEWFYRVRSEDKKVSTTSSRFLFRGTLALIVVYAIGYAGYFSQFARGFALRPFTPLERVLTEGRVLFLYLKLFFFPLPDSLHLVHDIKSSTGLFSPVSTALSWAFLLTILVVSYKTRNRIPELFLAVVWFAGFHSLEAGPVPLELAFEHRNYLPILMLSLLLALIIAASSNSGKKAVFFPLLILLAFSGFTAYRSHAWNNPFGLLGQDHARYPSSARLALYRANLLRDRGRLDKSYLLLSDFVKDHPDPVEHRTGFERAEIYVFLGNYTGLRGLLPDSVTWYKKALEVKPDHQLALYNLAQAYLDLGDVDSARTVSDRLEILYPDWFRVKQLKRNIRQETGDQHP